MTQKALVVRGETAVARSTSPLDLLPQARMVVEAGLAPEGMTPEQVAIIAWKGMDQGMTFMQALESFYVVKGKIGRYTAEWVSALRAHGHDYVVTESTSQSCTVSFYNRNGRELPPYTMTFADCEAAGWTKDSKGVKPMYAEPTKRRIIVRNRAISNGIRQNFPEVVLPPSARAMWSDAEARGYDPDADEGEIIDGQAETVSATPPPTPAEPLGRTLQGEPHWATLPSNRRTLGAQRNKLTLSNDEVMTALGEDLGQPIQRLSEYPFDLARACKALDDYVARKAGAATQPELPV